MKKALLALVFFVFAIPAAAQVPTGFDLSNYGVRIEPDKRVMIVLAALDCARTTDANGEPVPVLNPKLSPEGAKFREQLRSDLVALDPKLRERISQFVINHKKRSPNQTDAEMIASFVSMAYALSPAPDLADPIVTTDLPGNLLDVLDFAPLVRDFYRKSSISANLDGYVKAYLKISDGDLRASSREMVNDLLNYLHTRPQLLYAEQVKTETKKTGSKTTTLVKVLPRERERRFMIVPEMLAPVGNVIYLNVKDDYLAIVPPDTDISFSEVRRGYLQFVIDPIVLNNSKEIATIRDAVKVMIDERRKVEPKTSPDVYLTIARSLVAAIDVKQNQNLRKTVALEQSRQRIDKAKTPEEKKFVADELKRFQEGVSDETILQLSEEYEKGALLVYYFADQLTGIEDSGFDIASSMREMILSLDPAKEGGRYASYADARKRALTAREENKRKPVAAVIAVSPVTTRLVEIQKLIDKKNYSQANTELKTLLDQNPSEPRIYYNMGLVASMSAQEIDPREHPDEQKAKLLEAKVAYENVARLAQKERIDPALLQRSYVALAKIYEFYDNNQYAMSIYDAAIKLGDVAGGAYGEALSAKQKLLKKDQ